MALTISYPAPTAIGIPGVYSGQVAKCVLLRGDTAYPTGGYLVTPGSFGFSQQIIAINIYPKDAMPSGYVPIIDDAFVTPSMATIRFLQFPSTPTGPMNEVASGTNLGGMQITVEVWGY